MEQAVFDNRTSIVKDDLVANIKAGDKIAVAAAVFSMYAYKELKDQLESVKEFRFIFNSNAFTKEKTPKEKREFYIPRLNREQGLFGTEFEIKLRNELTQKAVAAECADWIRRKARFRSYPFEGGMGMNILSTQNAEDTVTYLNFTDFTTSTLGTEQSATAYASVARKQKLATLDAEIEKLQRQHAKEKQMAKRNELFKKLKQAKRERDALVGR